LRKHTEQQLADAQAVGLGDAALARFRATAAETAAVQANGGQETDEQAKKFAALKDSAAVAAVIKMMIVEPLMRLTYMPGPVPTRSTSP
jgi:hypothetical protein